MTSVYLKPGNMAIPGGTCMRKHSGKFALFLIRVWTLFSLIMLTPVVSIASQASTSSPTFTVMRQALQQALHLQFTQALETVAQLEPEQQPTLASRLTRGMIAYLQDRWQIDPSTTIRDSGHETLQLAIEAGKKQLAKRTDESEVQLFVGLAAIFDALLQQESSSWLSLQLFAQGQSLLQDVLIADGTMTDAHLGLGLLYFAGTNLPSWVRRFVGNLRSQSAAETLRHLQHTAEEGHFGQEIARTFLARIYELEHQYKDAIALGQALQQTFPENGYYRLLTGRSQCEHNQHASCAATLGELVTQLENGEVTLARHSDRFDLYYFWGRALHETERSEEAFSAFRQAINQDPRVLRDETLWAKYYLARLYEDRGQVKTARQIYHTLLRGRNVEDLHQQVEQRLARLQTSR
jgi:tetratricopeptide (TPR) repeat protein